MDARTQEGLAGLLRAKALRPTRQRLELLRELAAEPNDVTAQDLWQRLKVRGRPAIGLATVYRTLALLRDRGVIDALNYILAQAVHPVTRVTMLLPFEVAVYVVYYATENHA